MPRPRFHHRAVWIGAGLALATGYGWFGRLWRDAYQHGLSRSATALSLEYGKVETAIVQFSGVLVMAYVLAWLFKYLGVYRVAEALALIAVVWTGLIAAVLIPLHASQGYPLYLTAIVVGGILVQMLAAGVVIAFWRG